MSHSDRPLYTVRTMLAFPYLVLIRSAVDLSTPWVPKFDEAEDPLWPSPPSSRV